MSSAYHLGLRLCWVVASGWLGIAAAAPSRMDPVPRDKPIELRLLYLENPRLPTLSATQRTELNRKIEELLQSWFGYRARLRAVGEKNLAEYFAAHADRFRANPDTVAMNVDLDRPADRIRLRLHLNQTMASLSLAAIQDLLQEGPFDSRAQAVAGAENHLVKRLREIRAIPLPAGGTFFDPARPELNSYMHWCALLYEMDEADLVFTNGMVAGADLEMEPNIIARGGISTGITNANRHNAFAAGAMVGLFPFLSDAPFWLRERGPIPDGERLDVIATMAMHELGHMLLRTAHPANHPPNCIHAPEPDCATMTGIASFASTAPAHCPMIGW